MEDILHLVTHRNFVKPDPNAWLVPDFVAACKNFKNDFGLNLWEALAEYVSFHSPHCAFQGSLYKGELYLYPILEYNPLNRRATLKKVFFVSEEAKTIFMHDYLKTAKEESKNHTPFANILRNPAIEKFDEFPCLEFMIKQNGLEPALAKELLLKTSFYRRNMKRTFVLDNLAAGIHYQSTNVVTIDFDLSFLEDCSFLKAKRYRGFREFLPGNLIMSIGCRLEFEIPDIPRDLKQQQLLSIGSISS